MEPLQPLLPRGWRFGDYTELEPLAAPNPPLDPEFRLELVLVVEVEPPGQPTRTAFPDLSYIL